MTEDGKLTELEWKDAMSQIAEVIASTHELCQKITPNPAIAAAGVAAYTRIICGLHNFDEVNLQKAIDDMPIADIIEGMR